MSDERSPGKRRRPSLLRRTEGQAAFEFILILPFFILFLLLLVDLGILMYEYVTISGATRDTARFGSVNCDTPGPNCTAAMLQSRLISRSSGIVSDTSEVTVGWFDRGGASSANKERGDSVVVKVNHPYNFLFFPFTINVVSCADMRLERTETTANGPVASECD